MTGLNFIHYPINHHLNLLHHFHPFNFNLKPIFYYNIFIIILIIFYIKTYQWLNFETCFYIVYDSLDSNIYITYMIFNSFKEYFSLFQIIYIEMDQNINELLKNILYLRNNISFQIYLIFFSIKFMINIFLK